jgi:arylsulfatase A-like enzyme
VCFLHFFLQWDAGMATPDHTPHGRGYSTALHYYHHANDYWTMVDHGGCGGNSTASAECLNALVKACAEAKVQGEQACGVCAKAHLAALGPAGCSLQAVEAYCANPNLLGASLLKPGSYVDLWQTNLNEAGVQGPAHGYNNTCSPKGGGGGNRFGTTCRAGPKGDHWWGGYEDSLFAQQVLRTVEEHDVAHPYFLFWAPHIVHAPLEVPEYFYNKFDTLIVDDKDGNQRQTYHAMVDFADSAIGNFTAAIKKKEMWDDMIIVFSGELQAACRGPALYSTNR